MIKIIDSVISQPELTDKLNFVLFDTIGNVHYEINNSWDNKIISYIRFIIRRIDNTNYISIKDYAAVLNGPEKWRLQLQELVEHTNTLDELFQKFKICFKI